jgi:16S rRNA (uracil1498-N3)-methyltransferase
MKQSIKAYLPKLNPLTPFKDVAAMEFDGRKLIAYCGDFDEPHTKDLISKGDNVLMLIGPEGDFSPAEVELAMHNGFKTTGLGPSRLRTETAGVVACTIANLRNQA